MRINYWVQPLYISNTMNTTAAMNQATTGTSSEDESRDSSSSTGTDRMTATRATPSSATETDAGMMYSIYIYIYMDVRKNRHDVVQVCLLSTQIPDTYQSPRCTIRF